MALSGTEVQGSGGSRPRFLGNSEHSLDAKNRVFFPKRFHSSLDQGLSGVTSVVLTRGFDGCIFIFSESGFERAMARLDTAPISGSKARMMQRLFFGSAHPVLLDSSGRILIPDKLRQLAGIEKQITMVGVVERAEIWSTAAWEKYQGAGQDDFDDLDDVLTGTAIQEITGEDG